MSQGNSIETELNRFKANMLLARPFYGDILLRLPIVHDDSVETACTDGRSIRWSAHFFGTLTTEQRRYVLMHEVFHVLLRHPLRVNARDPKIWNVAADIIVNNMCDKLAYDVKANPALRMDRPPDGIFRITDQDATADNLYEIIRAENKKKPGKKFIMLRKNYRSSRGSANDLEAVPLPAEDLTGGVSLSEEEAEALAQQIASMIRAAAEHDRGTSGSFFIPRELLSLTRSKPLDWRKILKDFLSEVQADETSYATPERKYLHMDLILPGHGLSEEGELESVWAFVDSSGSVSQAELNEFLTQLYRIAKDFRCEMNIAYWDTSVTDVYEKLRTEKQVLTAQPKHSGGTDINCVYRFVHDRHLKPLVSLILTDGYFGVPQQDLRKALNPHSTILVISNESQNPVYGTIGRVCRLKA